MRAHRFTAEVGERGELFQPSRLGRFMDAYLDASWRLLSASHDHGDGAYLLYSPLADAMLLQVTARRVSGWNA